MTTIDDTTARALGEQAERVAELFYTAARSLAELPRAADELTGLGAAGALALYQRIPGAPLELAAAARKAARALAAVAAADAVG